MYGTVLPASRVTALRRTPSLRVHPARKSPHPWHHPQHLLLAATNKEAPLDQARQLSSAGLQLGEVTVSLSRVQVWKLLIPATGFWAETCQREKLGKLRHHYCTNLSRPAFLNHYFLGDQKRKKKEHPATSDAFLCSFFSSLQHYEKAISSWISSKVDHDFLTKTHRSGSP